MWRPSHYRYKLTPTKQPEYLRIQSGSSHTVKQLSDRDLEGASQCLKNAQTRLAPAILQLRDVNASDAGHLGKVLLVPATLRPQVVEPPTEFYADIICHYSSVALASSCHVVHEQH